MVSNVSHFLYIRIVQVECANENFSWINQVHYVFFDFGDLRPFQIEERHPATNSCHVVTRLQGAISADQYKWPRSIHVPRATENFERD